VTTVCFSEYDLITMVVRSLEVAHALDPKLIGSAVA